MKFLIYIETRIFNFPTPLKESAYEMCIQPTSSNCIEMVLVQLWVTLKNLFGISNSNNMILKIVCD